MNPQPAPSDRPWVMRMRWCDLLFAHWPVASEALRPRIPAQLKIETFEGSAWIGVIPFRMEGVRTRGLPAIPGTGAFEELNVRTYVNDGQRSGVWFFSLDASSRLAVVAARAWFRLNYRHAAMSLRREGGWAYYHTARRDGSAGFLGRYRPVGEPFHAAPGTLEHWLCERYCLFAGWGGGAVYRGDIRHAPWTLHRAEAEIEHNTMAIPLGIPLPDVAPHLLYSDTLDTLAWAPRRLRG